MSRYRRRYWHWGPWLPLLFSLLGTAAPCAASTPAPGVPLVAKKVMPELPRQQALALGIRIWQNESNRSVTGLTAWNRGENFASLGIGHFIWYPAGEPRQFKESFPALLEFMRELKVTLPAWLPTADGRCPWSDRDAFLGDFHAPRMEELRNFLRDTVAEQSLFIAARLKAALPAIINGQPAERQRELTEKFIALYTTDAGLYALIDYVNFKGEGIALSERYQGVGWGLAQVLEQMDMATAPSPVEAFAAGAATVLTRRVELAPSERNEQRWLPGWLKRINSYRR